MNRWLLTLGLWLNAGALAFGVNTKARLVLAADTVRAGDRVLAGVVLEMSPGWHTYWRNPGESGMATEIEWKLPEGMRAGEIQWPAPELYASEGFITYVLHDTAVLLVPLEFAAELPPGPLAIEAKVSWLECSTLCLPGSATVRGSVVVGADTKPSPQSALLAEAQLQLPKDGSALSARAVWRGTGDEKKRAVVIEWPATDSSVKARFFPYATEGHELRPPLQPAAGDGQRVAIEAEVTKRTGDWPTELRGVIVVERGSGKEAFEVALPIEGGGTAVASATATAGGSASPPSQTGLGFYLLLALGGGLILNLMPCVLPILSLKVLSLVRASGSSAGERRRHAVVYTLGVFVSFWVIGGLVIAGRLASWGEQFQDPRFIVLVTVLMTLVALNLFGLFEVVLPGTAVTGATQLASREGAGGAFFNGVLAVILGASCVAPMLAAAIGWAISQPPLIILLIFTLIGLGLALPFLVLSFFPVLQRFLPKPGPWMEKFKIAMGFPMLATAAWLLSQTANHFNDAGPLWVGLFLVFLALALWIYGEFVQRGSRRKPLATVLALLVAGGGYAWTLEGQLNWRHPPETVSETSASGGAAWPEGVPWQPWSVAAVEKARASGRPVLIDFTANWCLTCNTIVKPALEKEEVAARLKEMNAVALIADYTRKDPEILAELKRFQRAGVPLVVVYPVSSSRPPEILPDPNPLLGATHYAKLVLEALERAAE